MRPRVNGAVDTKSAVRQMCPSCEQVTIVVSSTIISNRREINIFIGNGFGYFFDEFNSVGNKTFLRW